jgi:hypothetical protein
MKKQIKNKNPELIPDKTIQEVTFLNVFLYLKATLLTVFGTLTATGAFITGNVVLGISAHATNSIAWFIGIALLLIVYTNVLCTWFTMFVLKQEPNMVLNNGKYYFDKSNEKVSFIVLETICVGLSLFLATLLVFPW